MNQKYIWLVTIVLCISLFGLILVQINFFQSASKIKEEQLALTVSKALDQVVSELERAEKEQIILEGDVSTFTNGTAISSNSSGFSINIPMDSSHEKAKLSFYSENKEYNIGEGYLNPEGLSGLSKMQSQFSKTLKSGNSRYAITIAGQLANSRLSLTERIKMDKLPQLIQEKLRDNGIKLNFEYAVKSNNKFEKRSKNYFRNPSFDKYSKQLFPNDFFASSNFLYLYFPGQQRYMVQSYSMLFPSLILTLVLILSSAFTIFIIFRQKRLSNIKNDFINNMTHEFKTPIATISLASQMLKDNTVTTTASTIDHIAKIINDESRRLTYQVEKVLQMAVFNEVRMKLKLKTVSVHKIIQNLLPNFTIRVEDRKGNMYQNIDAENDLVLADEVHLSNVFANLLDNAIKYCKDIPEISISTRNKNKGIVIAITDNGIGITKEDQKMIFERFYRVHTGNVHDVKGFGLGLSYVKKITDSHNGQVSVDSIPDKGTKFEIYLPLKK
jgi:two-component system phosphate regulon sensor histidine kinase PhoR